MVGIGSDKVGYDARGEIVRRVRMGDVVGKGETCYSV